MAEANTLQNGTQDEVAKIISCLIENGSTPSGPMLGFWELEKRTGIEALELYRVIKSVYDVTESKRLLEAEPADQINSQSAEERIGQRDKAIRPFKVRFRLSEVGIRLAKEEISVRYQYKQLKDFDKAARRADRGFIISLCALAVSLGMLIFKACETTKKDEPHVKEQVQSVSPVIQPDTTHAH
jgi:hypothetical protein